MGRHLLGPLERRVQPPGPGRRVVVGEQLAAQFVGDLGAVLHGLQLAFDGAGVGALQTAFAAGAVVADDVKDQGVVALALFLDRLDHPADLVIGLFQEAGIDLGLMGQQLLLLRRQRIPGRQFGRTRGQFGIGRDHPEGLLPGEGLFAQLVPTLVELALVLVHPFLGNVMGRVGGAGGEIEEERLVGSHRIVLVQPFDGVVGQIDGQVIARARLARGLHRHRVAIKPGLPLAVGTALETVKIFEAQRRRPMVEGTDRVDFPAWGVVPLAESRSGIAVVLQDLGHRSSTLRPDRIVARVTGGAFDHRAEADFMVVAPREQGGTGRRAQRIDVKAVVAQSLGGELFQFRRLDRPAQRRGGAEADIVQQHQQDVRCAGLGFDLLRPVGLRLIPIGVDLAGERRRRFRQGFFSRGGCRRPGAKRDGTGRQ